MSDDGYILGAKMIRFERYPEVPSSNSASKQASQHSTPTGETKETTCRSTT